MNIAVDRLTGLSSPLLDHILSLLPTKDVVRTCVLSKCWRNVWCYVSSFHFDDGDFSGEEDFFKFVDSALLQRDGSSIHKLCLTLGSMDSISDYTLCRANKWIIYAIRHNVEVLDMILYLTRGTSLYELTSQIFTCKSLRALTLTGTGFVHNKLELMLPASCCLPCLKFLQFRLIKFTDVQMTTFESSALPSLDTLIMQNCTFQSNKLQISFPRLKNLNYKGWLGYVLEISVDTPNLISLKLEIIIACGKVEFVEFNTISLVNANINLRPCYLNSLIKLFRGLESVRSLTLDVGNIMTQKDLSTLASIKAPFYNMKWLKIKTCFSDGDVGMINTLLKHSTQLETLFLEHNLVWSTEEYCFEAEDVWFKYNLPHLKLVEIQGFGGSENELKLTKFILKHAIVLEKVIITTYKAQDRTGVSKLLASKLGPKQLESTGRNLLNSPRASQCVSILFI